MRQSWIGAACVAALALSTVGPLYAQQRQLAPKSAPAFEHDPDLDDADQLAPSQVTQPLPAAVDQPGGAVAPNAVARHAKHTGDGVTVMTEPAARTKPSPAAAAPPNVVCGGVFAKDSNHLKLAAAFQKKNITDSPVDTATGGKTLASVLYAKDPQQRLEIWWSHAASHSDIHLIVINGKSTWSAPGGLRLGLTLADVEGLNGKPFKLVGFNKDGTAAASDWNGGALAAQTGGCKLGISLRPDPASPAAAVAALAADREFPSNDAAMRAVNPTVSEILIAY
jgi:hypothetical protein